MSVQQRIIFIQEICQRLLKISQCAGCFQSTHRTLVEYNTMLTETKEIIEALQKGISPGMIKSCELRAVGMNTK